MVRALTGCRFVQAIYRLCVAATFSDEFSCLEVMGTEGMITIEVVVVEECKVEFAGKKFCAPN